MVTQNNVVSVLFLFILMDSREMSKRRTLFLQSLTNWNNLVLDLVDQSSLLVHISLLIMLFNSGNCQIILLTMFPLSSTPKVSCSLIFSPWNQWSHARGPAHHRQWTALESSSRHFWLLDFSRNFFEGPPKSWMFQPLLPDLLLSTKLKWFPASTPELDPNSLTSSWPHGEQASL